MDYEITDDIEYHLGLEEDSAYYHYKAEAYELISWKNRENMQEEIDRIKQLWGGMSDEYYALLDEYDLNDLHVHCLRKDRQKFNETYWDMKEGQRSYEEWESLDSWNEHQNKEALEWI